MPNGKGTRVFVSGCIVPRAGELKYLIQLRNQQREAIAILLLRDLIAKFLHTLFRIFV